MLEKLKRNMRFSPVAIDDEDEYYGRGIFQWNISKIWQSIESNCNEYIHEIIKPEDYGSFLSVNEEYVDTVDLNRPVLLVEISPDNYSLIDGQHRVTKALRCGITTLPAYKLSVNQHINFMTSVESYERYLGYWNDKVNAIERDKRRRARLNV